MSKVYVRLLPAELDALRARAHAERRHPSDQAALLLAEALRKPSSQRKSGPAVTQETQPRQPVSEAGATP